MILKFRDFKGEDGFQTPSKLKIFHHGGTLAKCLEDLRIFIKTQMSSGRWILDT